MTLPLTSQRKLKLPSKSSFIFHKSSTVPEAGDTNMKKHGLQSIKSLNFGYLDIRKEIFFFTQAVYIILIFR